MDKERFFFGIDLGTTNSVAACYDSAKNICTTIDKNQQPLIKSQLWLDYTGEVKIGSIPLNRQANVANIKDIKSHMLFNSTFKLSDMKYNAVEASSLILRELADLINEQYSRQVGHLITDVTITVPAAFNNIQRANTIKAAKLANLNVISLINEPTAASLAYVEEVTKPETVLIYDLGGGTFDVSIVSICPSVPALHLHKMGIDSPQIDRQMVTVMRSNGDTRLGGNDLDTKMVELALYQKSINSVTKEEYVNLMNAAQAYKESTTNTIKSVEIGDKTVIFDDDIYCQATDFIFDRTAKIVKSLMGTVNAVAIDKIVFVGGSTKNKYLCDRVSDLFKGIPTYNGINPDLCVAIGAARNSFIMSGADTAIAFTDIVQGTYSILINTESGLQQQKMIQKGEPLPTAKTIIVHKTVAEQDVIEIPIYQGENVSYKLNHQIGSLIVENVPENLSIDDEIPCTVQVSKSGIISAIAEVSGKSYSTTIDTTQICISENEDEIILDLEEFMTNEFK